MSQIRKITIDLPVDLFNALNFHVTKSIESRQTIVRDYIKEGLLKDGAEISLVEEVRLRQPNKLTDE